MFTTSQAPGSEGGDVLGVVLARVRDELKSLVDVPVWTLSADGLGARLDEVLAVQASVAEIAARVVAEIGDRDLPRSAGASSITAHLITRHRMSGTAAGQLVGAAQVLHAVSGVTEPTRRAQACGQISADQARIIAEAVHRLPGD